ncbi:MAG: TatD family hydrolase [Thermodesulfobacteriota bacterium]
MKEEGAGPPRPAGKESFVDTHAHLDDPRFDEDREEVISRAFEAGVESMVTVGCWQGGEAAGELEKVVAIAEANPSVYAALGIHPHDAKLVTDETPFDLIRKLSKNEKVVAVGETGLDFHYTNSPPETQRDVFIRHIRLARELALPLIVHSREAEDETLDILRKEGAEEAGGVIHCFSGSQEMARRAMEMGFYLAFGGAVTFPKAEALREVVKAVPTERMLLETDCPYLAPVPRRGKRNEPAFVVETAKRLAELKGLSLADVARITTLNASELFGLPGKGARGGEEEARIAYPIRNSLYLNITNRCTNHCTFCAKFKDYTVKGHYLKLRREPTFMDVLKAVGPEPESYDELVFCGFGEPLIRLDLLRKVGLHFKKAGCRIRVDTDGLSNLVHGGNVLPKLMFVDCISVSMNAPDSETYQKLCKTPFGDKAYPAILYFLLEAKKYISKVVATVVAVPGLDVEACRRVAEDELGVAFRVRDYNEVG